jgi:2'-5' RNA ligase
MSRAGSLRLFVALELPAEVRARLAGWARETLGSVSRTALDLGGVPAGGGGVPGGRRPRDAPRILAAESLHLTLCFLGSRPVAELPALSAAVETSARAVGELSVGAPLWLPPRRPHSLAVEVRDADGRLAELQRALSRELAQASGWESERRRYRPHVTLARLRGAARAQRLPATPCLSFIPESLVLYRSQLAPQGAQYDVLAAHTLAPG